jgi:hypothetical protein
MLLVRFELTSFQHYWNVLPCTIGANVNVSGNNTHIEHLQVGILTKESIQNV